MQHWGPEVNGARPSKKIDTQLLFFKEYGRLKTCNISKLTSQTPILRKEVAEDELSLENGASHPREELCLGW